MTVGSFSASLMCHGILTLCNIITLCPGLTLQSGEALLTFFPQASISGSQC